MRIARIFLAIVCTSSGVFAQTKELTLKAIPLEVGNRNFYISKVIDSRSDTTKIGWCVLDKTSQGVPYTLANGLTKSFYDYLSFALKMDSGQSPLILNVISLVVTEKKKVMNEGTAKMVVQFLKEESGMYGKVFETTVYTETVSEIGRDIYTSHERRIRFLLLTAIKKMMQSPWKDVRPDFISKVELREESIRLDTLSKTLLDTAGMFIVKKQVKEEAIKLTGVTYANGFLPKITFQDKTYRTLWPLKRNFSQLNNAQTNKLYYDYKGKVKLSVLAFLLGGAFIGASFADDTDDSDLPNLGLAIPGVAFLGCSFPIYFQSKKLARKTVESYNQALLDK